MIENNNPISNHLKREGYYNKFREVYFPKCDKDNGGLIHIYGVWSGGYITLPVGITGKELLELRQKYDKEFKEIEGKTG